MLHNKHTQSNIKMCLESRFWLSEVQYASSFKLSLGFHQLLQHMSYYSHFRSFAHKKIFISSVVLLTQQHKDLHSRSG